jgi:phosphoglycerol transferase
MPIRIYNFSINTLATRKNRFFWYLPVFLFLTNVLWISRKFGNPTVEQFIFHVQFGIEGLNGYDKELVFNYFKNTVLGSLAYASIAILLEEFLLHKPITKLKNSREFIRLIIGNRIPLIIFILASIIASTRFGVYAYLSTTSTRDFIANNYVNPESIQIQPAKNPKNLLLIYIESMEFSYRREDIFGKNLISQLDNISGLEFSKYPQMPGTGWTIAGIVSTQCSIPLKPIALADGNLQGELLKEFLPKATCLGDTLKKLGYKNVFLGGASLDFAGKGKYFKTHSYDKVVGKKSWLASQKYTIENMNDWGLHDDDLFTEALLALKELSSNKKPFNLTLLTVDTHFPKGFISKSCKELGVHNYLGIVECTSHLTYKFIQEAKKSGYLDNTNIVIIGDHLSMPTPAKQSLDKIENRYIFNKWISSQSFSPNRKEITHFDIAPTIIEFLGHKIVGDRYGLGFSALNKSDVEISKTRLDELYEGLNNRSDYYNQLWYRNKNNH